VWIEIFTGSAALLLGWGDIIRAIFWRFGFAGLIFILFLGA
jgi:hypothetical protein